MKYTIGFPISTKENEFRRVLVPDDVSKIDYPENLYFENNYGKVLGIPDEDYTLMGCNVCERDEVIKKDIVCDPKVGDADYLKSLNEGQIIFGWVHATQNKNITDILLNNKLTAIAWENMFEDGRQSFWFNNELAGEAAIIHAFQCFGQLPYGLKVAVIGKGNTSRGAIKVLNMLGAEVTQYDRHTESLISKELGEYDVIVNCILWDVTRNDHIIYENDLRRMKKNSMIIDISCDKNGGIETSIPTTIEKPTYTVDGVLHYVVDHTPSIFYKNFSYNCSKMIYEYLNQLISKNYSEVITNSIITHNGRVLDNEIIEFQNRR